MGTDRAYAVTRTSEEAIRELRRCAGTGFDAGVVEVFCAAWATPRPEQAVTGHG
jgi:HD-GYP domain-containing protein (c-di-GMP phosphodiesterase class II)